jgi:hypothetical protein
MKTQIRTYTAMEILKQKRQKEIVTLMHPWLVEQQNIDIDQAVDRLIERPNEFYHAFKMLIDTNSMNVTTFEQVLNAQSPRLKAFTLTYPKQIQGLVKHNFLTSFTLDATADAKTSSEEYTSRLEALPLR